MNERAPNFQRVLHPPPSAAPLSAPRTEGGGEEGRKGLEAMHFHDATPAHMQQTHAGITDARTEGRRPPQDADIYMTAGRLHLVRGYLLMFSRNNQSKWSRKFYPTLSLCKVLIL